MARYDVQVRVEDGEWTDWLTDTLATEATYVAQSGQRFTFRVTATDNVGNEASAEATSTWPSCASITITAPPAWRCARLAPAPGTWYTTCTQITWAA
ncbi:MAG: hypothetical protein ACE5OS_15070 [Anaerolineae bacterium]